MDWSRVAFALSITAICACSGDDTQGSGGGGAGSTGAQTTTTTGSSGSVTSSASVGTSTTTATASTGAGAGGGGGGQGGQGGATTVGSGGTGGGGGSDPTAEPECLVDADCKLVDDCCTCASIPDGDPAPPCEDIACLINVCDSMGLPEGAEPACIAGRCVAGFECDWNMTACDAVPPDCPDGRTAQVQGACYGGCVPADECTSVASCEQCDGGLACVQKEAFVVTTHCVSRPTECGAVDCACMGPSVCTSEDEACIEQDDALTCSCTTC